MLTSIKDIPAYVPVTLDTLALHCHLGGHVYNYVKGKLELGHIIIASNLPVGEYVCSCQLGEYAQFQRTGKVSS
jgi:hypothetical protein